MTATEAPIRKDQIKTIMRNCAYNSDIKEEWVQWATGEVAKRSLHDLTEQQANAIIAKQTGAAPSQNRTHKDAFEGFDAKNSKHRAVLSMAIQAQWSLPHKKHGKIADMKRIAHFLKSDRSPVKKPLTEQSSDELSKTIKAFEGIVNHRYK